MIGDLAYRIGTLVGTGVGVIERAVPEPEEWPGPAHLDDSGDPGSPSNPGGSEGGSNPGDEAGAGPVGGSDSPAEDPFDDSEMLVNSILAGVAGWTIKKLLRPRSVSWPRVVVAGIGATVLSDVVGRALGPTSPERERAYADDPDALLVRLGAGIAMAAGYAALLYPRIPGSPLTRGLVFGAMEMAAAPHGGLVRVATDTPGLKFPLKDLAVPIDDEAGPLANLAFGLALGILYRPSLESGDDDHDHDDG